MNPYRKDVSDDKEAGTFFWIYSYKKRLPLCYSQISSQVCEIHKLAINLLVFHMEVINCK